MNASLKALGVAVLGGAVAGAVNYVKTATGLEIDPAVVTGAVMGVIALFIRKPGDAKKA